MAWQPRAAKARTEQRLPSIQCLIAAQYQLPLGTFLGVGALAVVYSLPWLFSLVNQHP